MRKAEFPFLADFVAITLRWLGILGVTIALQALNALNWLSILVLAGIAGWNIFNTILAILNRRMPAHRLINPLADGLAGALLFASSGGGLGGLFWIGILPLLSSGIYYELLGGIVAGVLFTFVQTGWILGIQSIPAPQAALPLNGAAAFNLGGGLIIGLIGRFLFRTLRDSYQSQVRTRKEIERRAQQAERDRMGTFYRLIETLSASLDYQQVLDSSLDLSATALGSAESTVMKMVSAVMLFGENSELKIGSARRMSPIDQRRSFPGRAGVLQKALISGAPCMIQEPAKDAELCQLVALQSCSSALALPLARGLQSFGVLFFAHPDEEFFTTDRISLLEAISHQAVIAIQNARLFQDLAAEKERIIETQDEARKKLARDLHDGPTQSIAAIAMRLNMLHRMAEKNPKIIPDELAKLEDLARRTTQEIRHMLFTLRPLVLESEGLAAALSAIAEKMHDTYQQNVAVEVDPGAADKLDMSKQTVVFYLVEEALNNTRKHAQASQVWVKLRPVAGDSGVVLLEVVDNGVGFDVQAVNAAYERRGSLGMVNLRERSELIGAVLNIISAPGKGTRVQVWIPITGEGATGCNAACCRLVHNGQRENACL
jgi:signal transduction histidine kinase